MPLLIYILCLTEAPVCVFACFRSLNLTHGATSFICPYFSCYAAFFSLSYSASLLQLGFNVSLKVRGDQ